MSVRIIAAMTEEGVIGRDRQVPWRLPADLERFRRLTTGHIVIVGRRTFESIGRPLQDRVNIVLTRRPVFAAPGAIVVHDLDAALAHADPTRDIFIIGGGEIYRQMLPRADQLDLTIVHAPIAGDTLFPSLDLHPWRLTVEERHPLDADHACAFTFRTYRRRR